MERILLIISISILLACNHSTTKKVSLINDLKLSSYSWHYNDSLEKYEFYVATYLNIKDNGQFFAMGHDTFMRAAKYFSGFINDTLRKEIDSILLKQTFDSVYRYDPLSGFLYCGFQYCLDYQKQNKRCITQFIPPVAPDNLETLTDHLDTLLFKDAKQQVPPFDIDNYKSELVTLSKKVIPELPKVQKAKFIPISMQKFKREMHAP